jgi:hypothetical protein
MDATPLGEAPRTLQHCRRTIDGCHLRRPSRGLDRQIALSASEIRDLQGRQQQAEGARPRRPAPARHELPGVARVRPGVRLEVFLAKPQHFVQARLVGAHQDIVG